jgi:mannose-6-phosphate isomerase-like protein (cupin superfamily)
MGPEDPDDYRPNSRWAVVIDPGPAGPNVVRSISLLFEECAAGDAVPLHTHQTDEAVIIDSGQIEARLGDERRAVGAGAVIFIPAGTPHGYHNTGSEVARFHGVFPTDVIDIAYIERNPAPGTEGDAPQPPFSIDLRTSSGGQV